jgi:NADPH:quinone reductase-like Zn-dependent oxidoreductase
VLHDEDFADQVRELTDGEGVAVVYDGVGASTSEGSLASLRPRGLLAVTGTASGPTPAWEIPSSVRASFAVARRYARPNMRRLASSLNICLVS